MNDDFLDLLRALLTEDTRFLVVGAHALAVHGVPRATGDLDVWLETDQQNAARAWRGLSHFGAPVADLSVPFLGRAALIANKRATGRLKDLADLEALGERPE